MRFQLIIASLVVMIGFVLLINFLSNGNSEPLNSRQILEQDFDYFMTNVNRLHFDQNGQADYRILADRLTHFPDPDFTLIDAPNFVIYENENSSWVITAENGKILQDADLMTDKVELSTNVIIHSVDSNGQDLNLYTEFLTLYPSTNLVSTDLQVRLISVDSQTTSLGMTADLNTKIINFLANVKGYYD